METHTALQPLLQVQRAAPGCNRGQLDCKMQGGGVQHHLQFWGYLGMLPPVAHWTNLDLLG